MTRLDELLVDATTRSSGRTALVHPESRVTYEDLVGRSAALADRLTAAAGDAGRFQRGARIAVIAPNVPALVAGMLACWRLGATAVPLAARLREHELRQALADAAPVGVVSVAADRGYSFRELLHRLMPELPSLRACLVVDSGGAVVDQFDGPCLASPDPLEESVAALLYTSGTTGAPKGSLVTHARELARAEQLARVLDLRPDETVALPIPASHAFGLSCLLATFAAGATVLLADGGFSPAPFLEALEQERASVLHGSPTLFATLLKARPSGVSGLRTGFVGGASAAPELFERLDARGLRLLNLYGLTETGVVSCCRLDDPLRVRSRTAGAPLPGLQLRIDQGELFVRGPAVSSGYHRKPDETADAFDTDGWFRTGDLAAIEEGRLRIAGRARELVHVGGFNVFPGEVEAVLLAHPDVAEAAVVGVTHPVLGATLRAFVVPRDGTDPSPASIVRFMRAQVAGYKVPYAVEIRRELPALASGKPDRRALVRMGAV